MASIDGRYQAIVKADSPAALWMLNETSGTTALEVMGAHNGTYTGTAGTDYSLNQAGLIVGESTPSASFSGNSTSGGYVSVPDSDTFSSHAGSSGQMTLEVLVHLTTGGMVLTKYGSGAYEFYLVAATDGSVTFDCPVLGGASQVFNIGAPAGSIPVTAPVTHLVAVYDRVGGIASIWVNGVMKASTASFTGTTSNGTQPLRIGYSGNTDGNRYGGQLAAVAYYTTRLADAAIKQHAAELVRGGVVL